MTEIKTDVLIVGTGPAGSSSAALLSSYGINIINTPTNYVLIESVYKDELIKFLESKNIFIRNLNHLKFMNNFARISIGKKSDMIYVANCIINFFKKSK